jgi:hypothetical protein
MVGRGSVGRTVVRHVLAHEVLGTCPVTGGCDGNFVKVGLGGYRFVK